MLHRIWGLLVMSDMWVCACSPLCLPRKPPVVPVADCPFIPSSHPPLCKTYCVGKFLSPLHPQTPYDKNFIRYGIAFHSQRQITSRSVARMERCTTLSLTRWPSARAGIPPGPTILLSGSTSFRPLHDWQDHEPSLRARMALGNSNYTSVLRT